MVLVFMVFHTWPIASIFLRPASDLHPAPFCGNRRADLARRGLLARPPRLDLLGMELATGVGVRLRLSRFDAALPEAAHPDRGHCFERFADMNADRGLDDNPSRYPTHINIRGETMSHRANRLAIASAAALTIVASAQAASVLFARDDSGARRAARVLRHSYDIGIVNEQTDRSNKSIDISMRSRIRSWVASRALSASPEAAVRCEERAVLRRAAGD